MKEPKLKALRNRIPDMQRELMEWGDKFPSVDEVLASSWTTEQLYAVLKHEQQHHAVLCSEVTRLKEQVRQLKHCLTTIRDYAGRRV